MSASLPWFGGASIRVLLDGSATAQALTMLEISADSGYVAARHVHEREDETFLVLSGSVLVVQGEIEQQLREGEAVWLVRGMSHGYRMTSDGTRLFHVSTPGGLDGFFRAVSSALLWPDGGRARLAEAAAAFGIRYT